jgi:hypothetical protein
MRRRDTQPRTECPTCERDVAVDTSGRFYRHTHGNGALCIGSRIFAWESDPNSRESESNPTTVASDPGPPPPSELATWWRDLADTEIAEVAAKAIEYGATDLRDLGYQILEMTERRNKALDGQRLEADAYATEIGIAFYAMGKLARIAAAIKEGRRPSLDSWHDLGVYARMAQRVHQVGAWPGIQKPILARRMRAHTFMTEEQIEQAQRDAKANGWDESVLQRVLDGLKNADWGS